MSAGAVTIRGARLDDARAIAAVHVASSRWAYHEVMPEEALPELAGREAAWTQILRTSNEQVVVAEGDDGICGFASWGSARDDDASARTGEVYTLYVDELSARAGVGSSLLAAAIDGLGSEGYEMAHLWVLESNEPARRFYEKLGWRRDGTRDDHDARCGGLPVIRYARGLSGYPANE